MPFLPGPKILASFLDWGNWCLPGCSCPPLTCLGEPGAKMFLRRSRQRMREWLKWTAEALVSCLNVKRCTLKIAHDLLGQPGSGQVNSWDLENDKVHCLQGFAHELQFVGGCSPQRRDPHSKCLRWHYRDKVVLGYKQLQLLASVGKVGVCSRSFWSVSCPRGDTQSCCAESKTVRAAGVTEHFLEVASHSSCLYPTGRPPESMLLPAQIKQSKGQ